jgi:hypothetical protein
MRLGIACQTPSGYIRRRMGRDLIFNQFSRAKIERADFSHFLSRFALDKLPTGRRLREMMDCVVFCVEGYDHDPREIHSIPEIRTFYRAFHDAWPYWLYFCNLDQDTLKTMVLCCLETFVALKVDGQPDVKVECQPLEMLDFIRRDFALMNLICERAAMFEDRIEQRTKAIFEYFALPRADEPPAPSSP